jgi:peptidoglycan hydrolase-like protein with peptidoglycan-binding domain
MSNALGDLISKGEGNYNSFNRGNAGDSRGQTIDFSQMTLGEVQTAQHLGRHDPHRLFAVGKYQIIPDTMDDAAKRLKLDAEQKFNPELQERIFADYLIAAKRSQIEAYIKGEAGVTLHAAQKAACKEWASVEDPDTPGKPYPPYLRHGNNHSSITSSQIASALDMMRAEYRSDIAKGMTPNEAWEAITHSTTLHDPAAPTHAPRPHTARVSHTREQGSSGQFTRDLQAELAGLCYLGTKDVDGVFGPQTRHAVEHFQRDHHLAADGKVGPLTRQAMHYALQQHANARDLSDPKSPDHALFAQALSGVRTLDVRGKPTEQQRLNLAAALTVEAKREGLTRIDQVALGDEGKRVYIAQHPSSILEPVKLGSVDTMTALQTPAAQNATVAAAIPSPAVSSPAPVMPPTVPAQAMAL